jgi:hypothetical protein
MDARYLQATTVLPNQDKVCGRTLRPFSLRHRVALESIGSPFLDPMGKTFRPLDVILAVRILSTYDKEKMSDRLTMMDKLHMMILNCSRKKLAYAIGRIIGCIQISCSYPKLWKKEKKEGQMHTEKMPMPLACIANLTRNGVGLEEAWTMPEGEAVWMSIAHAIYEGAKVDILSTDEEKELEKFHDRIADYKKRMNHN